MLRLMIVDDEPLMVDALYSSVSQLDPDEFEINVAYSSLDALALLETNHFDILVTDISMPVMNGIDLYRKVREFYPGIRAIFLTAYDEFDYLYQISKYDFVKYILKSEGHEQVCREIRAMADQIYREQQAERTIDQSEQFMRISSNTFFLEQLLRSVPHDLAVLQQLLEGQSSGLAADQPLLLLIARMDQIDGSSDSALSADAASYLERMKYYAALSARISKLLPQLSLSCSILKNRYALWLIQDRQNAGLSSILSSIHRNLDMIQLSNQKNGSSTVSFIYTTRSVPWSRLNIEIGRLLSHLSHFSEQGIILQATLQTDHDEIRESADVDLSGIRGDLEQVESLLQQRQAGRLHVLLEKIRGLRNLSPFDTYELFMLIAQKYFSHIKQSGLADRFQAEITAGYFFNLDRHGSLGAALDYFHRLTDHLHELQQSVEINLGHNAIQTVSQYIRNNPDKPLTLFDLAKMVYMNPSYLSRLFKKVTGMNINEYIAQIRMDKARELLTASPLKVYEVGRQVGFVTSTNFIRFFKKSAGVTPQEYRDGIR